jgi:hypothetical protein
MTDLSEALSMRLTVFGMRRLRVGVILLILLAVGGCGTPLYPVRGTVTFEDGTPVSSGGMVIFEKEEGNRIVMARGAIQANGSYQLSTYKPEDGAPAGKYRVRLIPPEPDVDGRKLPGPTFDRRYRDFKTSELEFEVKAGPNEYPIRVTRAEKTRR